MRTGERVLQILRRAGGHQGGKIRQRDLFIYCTLYRGYAVRQTHCMYGKYVMYSIQYCIERARVVMAAMYTKSTPVENKHVHDILLKKYACILESE